MCGRFVQYSDPEIYASRYALERVCDSPPRYNVAPTQTVRAIRMGEDGLRELIPLRWGLVPAWSKGPNSRYSMINARAETVATKPAYRSAFKSRRCLIPAEGFYEWRALEQGKQPYLIRRPSSQPFVMAGLWERWNDPQGEALESCTIIVTEANAAIAKIHDRMPVVLSGGDIPAWLNSGTRDARTLSAMLRPSEPDDWTLHPVSTRVNSPRNDAPDLLNPTEARADGDEDDSGSGLR